MNIPVNPRTDTANDRVCKAIFRDGPATIAQLQLRWKGYRGTPVKELCRRMLDREVLIDRDGLMTLAPSVYAHYKALQRVANLVAADFVQPATPQPFRPLSAKYIPSIHARRHDAGPCEPKFLKVSGVSPKFHVRGAA